MNLPDELRKLYEDTAKKVLAERPDVTLEEVDDRALATVLDRHEKMCLAKWLKELPAAAQGHFPAVASRYDGTWGVYCLACSAEAEDYTACKRQPHWWPPDVLADEAMVRQKIAAELDELKDNPALIMYEQPCIECGEVFDPFDQVTWRWRELPQGLIHEYCRGDSDAR